MGISKISHSFAVSEPPNPLDSLKAKLNDLLKYFDTSKRVVYFDYPLHVNVGDLLINLGTEQFLLDNAINVWKRYSCFDIPKSIPAMDDDVVILAHGGGNFGDIYPYYQSAREMLVARYPNNRIIVLPQTVHFASQDRGQESLAKFRDHRNLHIFVRDETSLDVLRMAKISQSSLMPDMAHYLWRRLAVTSLPTEKNPMLFARRDPEAKVLPGLADDSATTVDWWTLIPKSHLFGANKILKAISVQNRLGFHWQKHKQWYSVRDLLIRDAVRIFSKYREIRTNRLHAMILGILLEKEVTASDNSYGKLTSYYDAWLTEIHHLRMIRD